MKLWFVVTIFGKVSMTVGPIPSDDLARYLQYRATQWESVEALFRGGNQLPKIDGDDREITIGDVSYICHSADQRPAAGSDFPGLKPRPRE